MQTYSGVKTSQLPQKRSGTEASHLDPTIRQVVLVAKAEPEGSAGNRDRSTSARRHVELRGPSTGAKHGVRRLAGHLHGGSRSDCSERGVASDPVECRTTAVHYARAHPMLRSRPGLESAARGNAASCVSTTPLTWRRGSWRESLPFRFLASPPLARLRRCVAVACRHRFAASLPLSCAGPWSASSGITPGRSACFRFTHCWAIRSRREPLSLLAARPILRLAPPDVRLRFGTVSTGDVVANISRSDSPSGAPFALAVTRWTSTESGFPRKT
jgi:hypothetical protein